ncbi:MAG: flagellar biosynthesis anti-sigma factor FlgM [Pseudomonadota bacterium]
MTSKVNGVTPGQIAPSAARTASRERAGADGSEVKPGATGDTTTVNITSNAQLLGELDKALAGSSPVDPARIEAIRDAIASGSYEVDADKIAAALLRFERGLGPEG